MLGKLPVPGRPTILITVGQGPTALAVGAGGGCLDIFTLIYPFSSLSPSLWETARYRLKYCLKGPLNPKQPTNQLLHDVDHLPVRRSPCFTSAAFSITSGRRTRNATSKCKTGENGGNFSHKRFSQPYLILEPTVVVLLQSKA